MHLPPCIAVIGDLVGSREEPAAWRRELNKLVAGALGTLNRDLGPQLLAAPIVQTAGDEIQALFRGPRGPVELIQRLTDFLHGRAERPIAFGLGCGTIFTHDVPRAPRQLENVALVDGPAFHDARAALERVQKKRGWVACQGLGESGDLILDYIFESMWSIRSRWTALQSHRTVQMRELGVQKEVARQEGLSPSVVSEALKAASFSTILAGEEAARRALACFAGTTESP